jgi:hypothetical protein
LKALEGAHLSNFQWMKARDSNISQIHKSSPEWPDSFIADDLTVLQFPANESDQRALKSCMLNAIKGGTLPTARLTTTRGKLPSWGNAATGEDLDLRAYLRGVTAALETIEVVAIGRPAFAAFLEGQGIEPSEHVRAWLGERQAQAIREEANQGIPAASSRPGRLVTSKQLSEAFPHPKGTRPENWSRTISECPGWMKTAREYTPGRGGGRRALWNPAQFAICMVSKGFLTEHAARIIISRNFPEWDDRWSELTALL